MDINLNHHDQNRTRRTLTADMNTISHQLTALVSQIALAAYAETRLQEHSKLLNAIGEVTLAANAVARAKSQIEEQPDNELPF